MTDAFIYVAERRLPYETFDADNHLYENRDAMTKFLAPEFDGVCYARYTNEWEGVGGREFRAFSRKGAPGFLALASEKSNLVDSLASIIGHGLATRFPKLKFLPVEYMPTWIRPFHAKLQRVAETSSVLFDEDPVEVFRRNVYFHLFHEPDPKGLIDLGLPVDHMMFGSDFPHPEGMADPLAYYEIVKDFPMEQQQLIMGGSLEKAMKVGAYATN